LFVERIKNLKQNALKSKIRRNREQVDRPVSFWVKNERLLNEIGKEFTIILRTRGCSWSLSESGGCSMCGYIQDAVNEDINQEHIKNQFDYAYNNKIKEIINDNDNYVIKIFNSGSFFDDFEITEDVRKYIYEKIEDIDNVKEVVVESRIEYINSEKIKTFNEYLKGKYVEIAIGLETVNDYIRNHYINKGMQFDDFIKAIKMCLGEDIGVKAYLLFKPLFLNEQGAIDDCITSINSLIDLKINTISINPLNIQRGTLAEYLWYQNRYRPPWFHSLFKVLKKSLNQNNLKQLRVLSDPSGAGTKRGIHNCLKKECETSAKKALKNFVFSQDLELLEQQEDECSCRNKYRYQKNFS
jgi:radical SAM enzyme (TIGR01210 family)